MNKNLIVMIVGVIITLFLVFNLHGLLAVNRPISAHIFIIEDITMDGFKVTGISDKHGFSTKTINLAPVDDDKLLFAKHAKFGKPDIVSSAKKCNKYGDRLPGDVVYLRIKIKTKTEGSIDFTIPYQEKCCVYQLYVKGCDCKPFGGRYSKSLFFMDPNDKVDFDYILSGDLHCKTFGCEEGCGSAYDVTPDETLCAKNTGTGNLDSCRLYNNQNLDLDKKDKNIVNRFKPKYVCGYKSSKYKFFKTGEISNEFIRPYPFDLNSISLIDKKNRFKIYVSQNGYAIVFSKSFVEKESKGCHPENGKIEICPTTCDIPQGYMLAIETFSSGQTIDKYSTRYPISDFCLEHPAIWTDNSLGKSWSDASVYYSLTKGDSVNIGEGRTLTLFYIMKANQEIPVICDEGYNINTGECGTEIGVIQICSEGQFDPEQGLCVIQPDTVCEKGYYDTSIKKCVWHPPLQAICERGIYNPDTGNCEYIPEIENVCDIGFYDATINKCVVKAEEIKYECPEGTTWDSNRNVCVSEQFEIFCQKGEYKEGKCIWQPEVIRKEQIKILYDFTIYDAFTAILILIVILGIILNFIVRK